MFVPTVLITLITPSQFQHSAACFHFWLQQIYYELMQNKVIPVLNYDRLCGLVVRVPSYRTEMCFLWCMNWIYICYVEESRLPLWSSGQSFWLQNGDVLCFLSGTNWIYICYVEESRPPLWSSGRSSWLQNGYVLCFLSGTNWVYLCYVEDSRPPLWSSGQSSWLQKGDV
jgi:hypothetical protein